MEPIFFEPVFKEKIWGGTALQEIFNYDIFSNNTGECWGISAHPNGMTIVKNGKHKGKTLKTLWENNAELFGNVGGQEFPLLVKILDANQDLSIQVHPDDDYVLEQGLDGLGKTECWYILDCDKNAEIVYGHNANTKEEFITLVKEGKYNELFRRVKVKPGDFYFIPSGTVHALCRGTLVLEIQQSSDITYRIYDYDRKGTNGKKRELHLKDAMDVLTIPNLDPVLNPSIEKKNNIVITMFIRSKHFNVYKWDIKGEADFIHEKSFSLVTVINGTGLITNQNHTYSIQRGDHFLLPSGFKHFTIIGSCQLLVTHI